MLTHRLIHIIYLPVSKISIVIMLIPFCSYFYFLKLIIFICLRTILEISVLQYVFLFYYVYASVIFAFASIYMYLHAYTFYQINYLHNCPNIRTYNLEDS